MDPDTAETESEEGGGVGDTSSPFVLHAATSITTERQPAN
jgi:hypothetical protein